MEMFTGLFLFPAFQVWQIGSHKSSQKSGKPHLLEFAFANFSHFFHRALSRKVSILITIPSVHSRLCPIGIRPTTHRILLHRHPATLTIFVCCFHRVLFLIISLYKWEHFLFKESSKKIRKSTQPTFLNSQAFIDPSHCFLSNSWINPGMFDFPVGCRKNLKVTCYECAIWIVRIETKSHVLSQFFELLTRLQLKADS